MDRGDEIVRCFSSGKRNFDEMMRVAESSACASESTFMLRHAMKLGKYAFPVVRELILNKGADVRTKGKNGNTLMHDAIASSDLFTASLLVDKGVSVSTPNDSGEYPIHLVKYGRTKKCLEILRFLINAGEDVNRVCETSGTNPLLAAVRAKNLEAAQFLVEFYGANVNFANPKSEHTVLSLSLLTGSEKKKYLEWFVSKGARCVAGRHGGILHQWVSLTFGDDPNEEILRILIDGADAKVNALDQNGRTAMFMAVQYRRTVYAEILLKNGCSPVIGANEHSETCLEFCEKSPHPSLKKFGRLCRRVLVAQIALASEKILVDLVRKLIKFI